MASRGSTQSKRAKGTVRGIVSRGTKAGSKSPAKKPARAATKAPAKSAPGKKAGVGKKAARKPSARRKPVSRYHTVTPFLNVRDASAAIEFYKKAFGAEERLRMPNADGTIMHAELVIGDSTIMLSDAIRHAETRSSIHLTVDDCDAIFARAVSAGGIERMPLQDMFWGDRYGQLEDPFGNVWAIASHKEVVPPDELARRAAEIGAPRSGRAVAEGTSAPAE